MRRSREVGDASSRPGRRGLRLVTETFTSSQTWIPPAGVYWVEAVIVGGGGGGAQAGGGGGGGVQEIAVPVTPGVGVPVVVGAGGAGATSTTNAGGGR